MYVVLSVVQSERPFTEATRNRSRCKLSSNDTSKLFNKIKCRAGNLQSLRQQFLSPFNPAYSLPYQLFQSPLISGARLVLVCQLLYLFQRTSTVSNTVLMHRGHYLNQESLPLRHRLQVRMLRPAMFTAILLAQDRLVYLALPIRMVK